jgi:DNA-binding NarL/FixJ family response regulator
MNCLIIDDNKIARIAMKQLASRVSMLQVLGECATAMEAYNLLQLQPVDLLLPDIEMPEMTGIELIRNLGEKKPIIIFTTATKEHAVEANGSIVSNEYVELHPAISGRITYLHVPEGMRVKKAILLINGGCCASAF